MKVFISWSGERSEALAKALREWFPLVLHYVDPWLSKSDIQAGERWSVEIAKELEVCNFGIICITKENINAPWILFEAGALAKSMQDGRVIPLLLDVDFKEVTGPLAQFQAKKADNPGMKELVQGLNKSAASPVLDSQVERLYAALWADLEKQITSIPKSATPTKHSRPQGEILEELVSGVRSVEMRVRDISDEDSPFRRKRRRHRMHPMMISEIAHRLSDHPRDPIHLLLGASLLRDELPWLYELGLDAYRSAKSGESKASDRARRQFFDAIEMLERGPFMEDFGVDPHIIEILRREFRTIERVHKPSHSVSKTQPAPAKEVVSMEARDPERPD